MELVAYRGARAEELPVPKHSVETAVWKALGLKIHYGKPYFVVGLGRHTELPSDLPFGSGPNVKKNVASGDPSESSDPEIVSASYRRRFVMRVRREAKKDQTGVAPGPPRTLAYEKPNFPPTLGVLFLVLRFVISSCIVVVPKPPPTE